MKSVWLKAAVLAVSMVVSACGGTQDAPELSAPETDGVQQMLPRCDDQGRCPTGFYCDGGTCRRGVEAMLPQCDEEGQCPTGFSCPEGPGSTCRKNRSVN